MRTCILRTGAVVAVLLGAGALHGWYSAVHGRHWMTRANGGFALFFCGLASLGVVAWLAAYAAMTSEGLFQLARRHPSRARWVRGVLVAVEIALGVAVPLLLLSMPIA